MIIRNNLYMLGLILLIIISSTGCEQTKDPDQSIRLQQLANYCDEQNLDLSSYDYVLIEGRIKCKGCVQVWPDRIKSSPLIESSVLVVSIDNELVNHFGLEHSKTVVTDFDSIDDAFPYLANYFVFFRTDGEFDGYVELGSRNFPIPESTR